MALIGDREGVEYTVGTEDNTVPVNPDLDVALFSRELNKDFKTEIESAPELEDIELDKQPDEVISGGLMSRRI